MTAEADLWQQVARGGGRRLAGYFAGSSASGALLVAQRSEDGAAMGYIAFRGLPGGGVREYLVSGVEVRPDFGSARHAPEGEPQDVLAGALGPGVRLAGTLPTSDGASFAAVRTETPGMLRAVAMWPDGVGTMVVVPTHIGLPEACLIESPEVASAEIPKPRLIEPPRADDAGTAKRSRRPLFLGAGVIGIAIAASLAYKSGLLGGSAPVSPSAAQIRPDSQVAAPPVDSEPSAPKQDTIISQPPPEKKSEPATPPSAPKQKKEPARDATQDRTSTPPPAPRAQDDAVDIRELTRLKDLATGTQAYTTVQWMALASSAERLFSRLVEAQNTGEAARVIVQAYTRAGGDAAACRYLSQAADVSAGERALFREVNRCN